MDRRTIIAIVLSILIILGWQKFVIGPRMPAPTAPAPTVAAQNEAQIKERPAPEAPTAKPARPEAAPKAEQIESVPVSTGTVKVSNANKIFTEWDLKSYRLGISPEAASVGLKSVTHQDAVGDLAFDHPEYAYLSGVRGDLTKTAEGVIWNYEDDKIKLVRETLANPDLPYIDVKMTATFKSKRPSYAFVSLVSQSISDDPEAQDRQLIYWANQSVERVPLHDDISLTEVRTPVKWIGATNRYFLASIISEGTLEPKGLVQPIAEYKGRVSLVYPVAGDSVTIPVRVFFGPKEINVLRQVEPTLDHTVDLGWFTFIAYPLLKLMKWFYQFVHNYGVAIILLTILLKIVTYPLTYKSMKSMKEMAKIQPQLQKIREKYKDDKEALNREMLTLMKTHGYNPMAGCLPILIQMPVFFALYRVLYSSIELYHAPFAFWIQDLSAKDPFYVTPILLTATMWMQQKLTPNTATDPMQQKMMQLMPIIFGAFMITLPSGLTIYMLTNAVASIVQQIILNKKLGIHAPAATAKAR